MRWYLLGPVALVAFFSLVTWHWALFGISLITGVLIWEIAEGRMYRINLEEIERYANDRDDTGTH